MVRKIYLTPPDVPEGSACRTLRMPASKEWLGIFNNALLTLTDSWRYEQVNGTDLTIDETIEIVHDIINQFWSSSECDVCLQPNGMPFIRLGEFGQTEMLGEEGWGEPTGDYTIPAITPREGGTAQEQICLAAANAMNVLKEVYEVASDSFNGGLTNAETLTEVLLVIAALIAAAVALWAAAIIALVIVVWDIIYDTLEFIAADLWDANFDEAMKCILYNCATNDDGVVTFSYDCVIGELARQTDVTGSLTFDQLRLFGQIVYMLQFIGADGLNLAGATTAITSADCDDCEINWCYHAEFDNTLDVFSFVPGASCIAGGTAGTVETDYLQSLACFQSGVTYNWLIISTTFAMRTVTLAEFLFDYGRGSFANYPPNGTDNVKIQFFLSGALQGELGYDNVANINGVTLQWTGSVVCDEIRLRGLMCDRVTGSNNGYLRVYHAQIQGIGTNPIGTDNCP